MCIALAACQEYLQPEAQHWPWKSALCIETRNVDHPSALCGRQMQRGHFWQQNVARCTLRDRATSTRYYTLSRRAELIPHVAIEPD
jgi:hypothetical protein